LGGQIKEDSGALLNKLANTRIDRLMDGRKDQKIRILVPIRYPVGGIRTYLKYTFGKLDRDRYRFDFVAPSKEWLDRIKMDLKNFEVVVYPTSNKNKNGDLLNNIFKLLWRKDYKIIHSQGYTAGILTNIANIIFRIPHIITLHHVFGHGQFSDTFFKSFRLLKRQTIQYILSFADKVQTVSDDAMDNLLQYFPGMRKQQKKLLTIRNGIDTGEFLDANERFENPLVKEKGKIYLGFLGRYMPEKGFPYIIDAMEEIVKNRYKKNFRIITVGNFRGFVREYRKAIEKKGLTDYFIFLGFKEKVAPVLKFFDVLLIPSLGEACPIVPMEGLICGTPIVAFSCIGLREVLRNTPAKMVPVGDTEKFVQTILKVSKSLDKTKKECTDFIPHAIERFDVKKAAMKLESVFTDLLSLRSNRATNLMRLKGYFYK
jgi:glycosyltransferase involved in cell wall biosynthesis